MRENKVENCKLQIEERAALFSFPRSAWECLPGTLRVPDKRAETSVRFIVDDAERRGTRSHAERGNEVAGAS